MSFQRSVFNLQPSVPPMTSGTPMSGRDTAAAFKGLIIGLIALAAIVLATVKLTNDKFDAHESAPAAAESH